MSTSRDIALPLVVPAAWWQETKGETGYSQELAICLRSDEDDLLRLAPGDISVEPGHLLVRCGGNQLLQLWFLTDDGLLQSLALP